MEKQTPLQERIIAKINETEHLSAILEELKQPETALFAISYVIEWYEAAKDTVHLCRLACLALSRDELNDLIDRINAIDEGNDLWEYYTLAEWFDDWSGFNMDDITEEGT